MLGGQRQGWEREGNPAWGAGRGGSGATQLARQDAPPSSPPRASRGESDSGPQFLHHYYASAGPSAAPSWTAKP